MASANTVETALGRLGNKPVYFADCCAGISWLLLESLAARLPPAPALVLSIGSGSGLLEGILLRATDEVVNIYGVEVGSCQNKHLPLERILRVPCTASVHTDAMLASTLLFVYPRKVELIRNYIDSFRDGAVEQVVWYGHKSDWPEVKKELSPFLFTIETIGEPDIADHEILVVATFTSMGGFLQRWVLINTTSCNFEPEYNIHQGDISMPTQAHSKVPATRLSNGLIDIWEHAALLYHGYEWQGAASAFRFLAQQVEAHDLKQLCSINISLIQARMGEYRAARDTLLEGSTTRISLALTPYILGLIEWELGHAIQAESCLNASLELLLRHGSEDLNSRGMAFVLRAEDVRMHLTMLRESRLRTAMGEVMPVLAMRLTAECIFEAPARSSHPHDAQAWYERDGPEFHGRPSSGELLQPTVYVPPDTRATDSRQKAVDSFTASDGQERSLPTPYSPPARVPQRPRTRPTRVVSSLYSNDDDEAEMQARVSGIISAAGSSAPRSALARQLGAVPPSPATSNEPLRAIVDEVDRAFSPSPAPSLRLSGSARPRPRPRSSIMSTKSMASQNALPGPRPKYVPLMEAAKARGMYQTAPIGLTNMIVISPQASTDIRRGLSSQPSLKQWPSMQSTQVSSTKRTGSTAERSPYVTLTSAARQSEAQSTASSSSLRQSSTGRVTNDSGRKFIANPGLQRDTAHDSKLPAHPRIGRWTEDGQLEDDWLDKISRKIAGPSAQPKPRRESKKRASKDSGSTSSSRHGFSPIFSRFQGQSKSTSTSITISPPEHEKPPVFSSLPLDSRQAGIRIPRDPRGQQEDLRLLAQFCREYDGTPFPELSRRMLVRNNALDDMAHFDSDDDEPEPTTTDIELAIFLRNAARDRLCLDEKGNFNYRHAREDMLIGAPDPFLNGLTLRKAKKGNSAPKDLENVKGKTVDPAPHQDRHQHHDSELLLPTSYNPSRSLPPAGNYGTYNPFTSSSSSSSPPPTPSTTSTRRSIQIAPPPHRSIQMIPVPPTPRKTGAWDHLHTAASSSSSLFAGSTNSIDTIERRRRATDAALRMLEGRCRVRRDGKGDVTGRETVRSGREEVGDQPKCLRLGGEGKGKRLTGGTAGYGRAVAERDRRQGVQRQEQMEQQSLQQQAQHRQAEHQQKHQQQAHQHQQEAQREQTLLRPPPRPQPQQDSSSEGGSITDSLTPAPLRIASSKVFGLGGWDGKRKP
ncbi:hypothetical protein LTR78_005415 [Recurvomyces mirabilis]|uniref:Uncharacterized protein n=1 Tax=Recurvomyces mirabilis TaxID=574656 RepID=A0AAE0WMT1_9PEZI|nr:hypothetical protein LTR78_005415 [Recurvomyces mirabilis]KAK5152679.1 hypothetical protein LTS14_008213 [Recurvomyces mirabilis]